MKTMTEHNDGERADRGAKYMPTPAQIRRHCERIRRTWTEEETQRRMATNRTDIEPEINVCRISSELKAVLNVSTVFESEAAIS